MCGGVGVGGEDAGSKELVEECEASFLGLAGLLLLGLLAFFAGG